MSTIDTVELPEITAPKAAGELCPSDTDVNRLITISKLLWDSQPRPKGCANWQSVFAKLLAGRELGLPVMASVAEIDCIEGKLGLSAIAKVALIRRRSLGIVNLALSTESEAVVKVHRADWPEGEWQTVRFTTDHAKAAGLSQKRNWQAYPQSMLAHRAQSIACRLYFQELFAGIGYDADELGADTDENCRPIDYQSHTASVTPDWSSESAPVAEPPTAGQEEQLAPAAAEAPVAPPDLASEPVTHVTIDQKHTIRTAVRSLGLSKEEWSGWLASNAGVLTLAEIPDAETSARITEHLDTLRILAERIDGMNISDANVDRMLVKRGVTRLSDLSRVDANGIIQKLSGVTTPF